MKKKTRFIVGIAAFLVGVVLSFCTIDILGEFAMLFVLIGAVIFVYLNPELMRGE